MNGVTPQPHYKENHRMQRSLYAHLFSFRGRSGRVYFFYCIYSIYNNTISVYTIYHVFTIINS
jgi:uncharacterized membrane protein YhaH (DUF805 family)